MQKSRRRVDCIFSFVGLEKKNKVTDVWWKQGTRDINVGTDMGTDPKHDVADGTAPRVRTGNPV